MSKKKITKVKEVKVKVKPTHFASHKQYTDFVLNQEKQNSK